ncbi:MAG: hypothetical protein JWM11_8080 [Planctomycetaceae bacterium]|nr:hypothetical protein [Planctomycetaceae bacterium]
MYQLLQIILYRDTWAFRQMTIRQLVGFLSWDFSKRQLFFYGVVMFCEFPHDTMQGVRFHSFLSEVAWTPILPP